ncbi:MAG: GNAT family N-acetyltransferase [Actinomycetota bacterium]
MEVRPARLEDIEQMLDNLEGVAAEGRWIGAELPLDREGVARRWRERMEDPDAAMFVAAAEGRVIGGVGVTGRGPTELGMQVEAGRRRRGVGSALLRAAIEWARAVGSHKITLQVWPHNEAALQLYERFGFEREGCLRKQWRRANGELWDAVIMGLVLDDSVRKPEPGTPECGV